MEREGPPAALRGALAHKNAGARGGVGLVGAVGAVAVIVIHPQGRHEHYARGVRGAAAAQLTMAACSASTKACSAPYLLTVTCV
eukprot:73007-Pleurochrysis_carterae.AAC.1